MKIILYANKEMQTGFVLRELILSQLPGLDIENSHTIDELTQTLRQPMNRISVALLCPACDDDLNALNRIHALFDNTRIIMVLPDRTKHTLSKGIRMNPSFIGYVDGPLLDITSVLKKIENKKRRVIRAI